ncbi:MAG: hypothetical protein JOS17DRAFT_197910 [Linnemannia elongata]|nr:MAG: hypothetical protein JOS17DRAFT_197910 [Linnemannia elongata]
MYDYRNSMKLGYLFVVAIPLVHTFVEAGSYTLNACWGAKLLYIWDSEGPNGPGPWTATEGSFYVHAGNGVSNKVSYNINNTKKTAIITYRGKKLTWKEPNNEILWTGAECLQFWGSF